MAIPLLVRPLNVYARQAARAFCVWRFIRIIVPGTLLVPMMKCSACFPRSNASRSSHRTTYHDDPLYISALANSVTAALQNIPVQMHLLPHFTACRNGISVRVIRIVAIARKHRVCCANN